MIELSNAAGTVKLYEQAAKLAPAPVDELVLGSYTLHPRDGNGGKVYHSERPHVLNALGLPNPGLAYLIEHARSFADLHRRVIVSIAGFSADQFVELATPLGWAHAIELNFGCPNIWDDGSQKGIASFDVEYMHWVVNAVRDVQPEAVLRAKLSPYSDPRLLAQAVEAVAPLVDALVLSNTFPNAWLPYCLDVPYGGLSGSSMKAIVLGQVRQAQELTSLPIIAAGGVRTNADLNDYEQAGAALVQVGSRFLDGGEDPDVFTMLRLDHG
jgi:dihydroorotate dehydrogenase